MRFFCAEFKPEAWRGHVGTCAELSHARFLDIGYRKTSQRQPTGMVTRLTLP